VALLPAQYWKDEIVKVTLPVATSSRSRVELFRVAVRSVCTPLTGAAGPPRSQMLTPVAVTQSAWIVILARPATNGMLPAVLVTWVAVVAPVMVMVLPETVTTPSPAVFVQTAPVTSNHDCCLLLSCIRPTV